MKSPFYCIAVAIVCMLSSCNKTNVLVYQINEPVVMSLADFRTKATVSNAEPISKQGKMCLYNGYLYISEPEKGIHIIDNRNPSSPVNAGFINLLGNVDLAVYDDILYADSYIDLVWFDLSNPVKPEYKGRMEEVFPHAFPEICNEYGADLADYYENYYGDKRKAIIVGWKLVKRTVKIEEYRDGGYYYDSGGREFSASSNLGVSSGGSGVNGSMTRFTIHNGYLFTVINNMLNVFDLAGATPEKKLGDFHTGYNVETLFYYKNSLFMGTPTGLLIYNIDNPLNPEFRSFSGHVWGCDPVVVENDVAYVTVRSGNMCGQDFNELIILDVSDTQAPKPIVTYAMTNPKGLGIDKGTLFVCDDGLKIYKADNPQTIMANELAHYKGMDGYDVIPFFGVLMMIADDGIYQYDYKNIEQIKQLSKLKIGE